MQVDEELADCKVRGVFACTVCFEPSGLGFRRVYEAPKVLLDQPINYLAVDLSVLWVASRLP